MAQRVEVGTVLNGLFTAVPDPQNLGYWLNNQFYPHDCGYDFSQYPNCVVYYRPTGWETRPGQTIAYRGGGQLFRTMQEANAAASMVTLVGKKICVLCSERGQNTVEIFKKNICVICLKRKVISNELFSTAERDQRNWTGEIICKVLEALYTYLPASQQSELPVCYPIPHETFLCYGKVEALGRDGWYPGRPAHIAGEPTKCKEESCPNGHDFCKNCASQLMNCTQCGAFIPYEEPDRDDGGCGNHCPSFTVPCSTCGLIVERRKRAS
jgi:hypothetical protein